MTQAPIPSQGGLDLESIIRQRPAHLTAGEYMPLVERIKVLEAENERVITSAFSAADDCQEAIDQQADFDFRARQKLEARLASLLRVREAAVEADKLLEGMWSFSADSRAAMAHTWFVKASDVLRAALADSEEGGK